jgi:hypothetical protein
MAIEAEKWRIRVKRGCEVLDPNINLSLKWYEKATTLPDPRKRDFSLLDGVEKRRKTVIGADRATCG